jgi:phage terminase large subunit-like protein
MTRYSAAVLDALPLAGAEWEAMRAAERTALGSAEQVAAFEPLPHQTPPAGDWDTWLLLAGRGSGKTAAAAHYTNAHVLGPPCLPGLPGGHRIAIIAPTFGDALEACVNGPSGLRAHNPAVRSVQTAGGTFVRWPSGAEAKLFGASTPEDVERLRAGGNRCFVYAEELAAWRFLDQCWDHLQFGLRLGPHPRIVAATTPKPKRLIKALLTDPSCAVTRATTHDNPHLAEIVRARLQARYGGTRLGRQEIAGELVDEVEGALWTYAMIRYAEAPADLVRVVVAVDPAATSGEESDETGIVVAALGGDGRGYVLADRSCRLSPDGWARRVVAAYDDLAADLVIAEVNNGGEMVEHTIRTVRRQIPYKQIHASRGKQTRAQPVAALYEQGRVTHCEMFAELEDQLTQWTPESGTSPDRLDALVWAMTELLVREQRQVYVY